MTNSRSRPARSPWPSVYVGNHWPPGRKGQRCRRIRRGSGSMTLVKFKSDGRTHWVDERLLVKLDEH